MNWPNHTDYQDAIQNPNICFAEPELKGGVAACDMLGLPRVMSGNFASVYEVGCGQRKWAIRCFVRPVSNQQVRYGILTRHLEKVAVPWLVGFEFQLRGIRVHADWYPIVKMEWVEGVPFHVFADEHVKKPEALLKLTAQLRQMLKDLRQHRIAHGDLQQGNLLVTPQADLRLVDYDGMYVPAFGRGKSPELGHANFQHPGRTPDYYEDRLDNFAALVIHTSLLGLAKEPELWQRFHTGDNLLFTAADYKAPDHSAVLQRLKQSPDAAVRQLALLLERCCHAPVEAVPWFEETLQAIEAGSINDLIARIPLAPPPEKKAPAPAAAPGTRSTAAASPGTRSTAPSAGAGGSRSAAATGTRVVATPPAKPKPARVQPQPMNFWAGMALIFALAAFVQPFRLWAGPAAVACGIVGWRLARAVSERNWWMAIAGLCLGAGMTLLGVLPVAWKWMHPARVASASPATTGGTTTPVLPTKPGAGTISVSPPSRPTSTPAAVSLLPKPAPPAPAAPVEKIVVNLLGTLKGHGKEVNLAVFSPDNQTLASGCADGTVKLWDAQSGRLKQTLAGHTDGVESLVFFPGGKMLAVVCTDNTVKLWDVPTGQLKQTLTEHRNNLWAVTFSPDARLLATGSNNRRVIRLLEAPAGAPKRLFPEQTSWVKSVVFSPDGATLACACHDDTVTLWDVESTQSRQSLTVRSKGMDSVVFSPDGKTLASGSEDRTVRLWNTQTGALKQSLKGHTADVRAVAFSSDGKWVASGSDDKTARIWDAMSGELKATLTGHEAPVRSLAFSADGKTLATGSDDRTVKLWNVQRVKP